MRRYLAVLLVLVVVAVPSAAWSAREFRTSAPDLTEEEVSFRSGDLTLHGTVLIPRGGSARRPAMVIVHGSGTGVPRANLRPAAEAFAAGGVVTLIYDKRAAGYSPAQRDFSLLADDALAAVAVLRARSDVDPANVGLWGISEGGWVAPIAAARSADVAFLIVVAANGIAPARQQAWAYGERQRHRGITSSGQNAFSTTLVRLLAGAGMFAQAGYDPVPVLEQVRQPVLAIWGGKDRLTPPGEGLRAFHRVLSHSGNPHYTLRVFPEGNHGIHRAADDGFTRTGEMLPGYPELVTSWVAQVAAGRAPAPSADAAPAQDRPSPQISPLAWWESPWMQLATMLLFFVAFLAYPVTAAANRLRRKQKARMASARWLAATGLACGFGWLVYSMLVINGAASGPVIAGRSLVWLLLQLLAIAVVVTAVITAIRWRRVDGGRARLGLLLTGAAVFTPWAIYWGLLLP